MITPQVLAAGLRAFANAIDGSAQGAGNAQGAGSVANLNPTAYTQTGAQPIQTQPVQQAAALNPNVTDAEILALIQPHIGNDAIKAQLGVAMRNIGVNQLPEAQPHQFPALYAAFQQVLQSFGIGGAVQQQPQSASII